MDNNRAKWNIEYDSLRQPYAKTLSVQNTASGKWKTITFEVKDASFANRQKAGNDFRIFDGGLEDLTIELVRVIKI